MLGDLQLQSSCEGLDLASGAVLPRGQVFSSAPFPAWSRINLTAWKEAGCARGCPRGPLLLLAVPPLASSPRDLSRECGSCGTEVVELHVPLRGDTDSVCDGEAGFQDPSGSEEGVDEAESSAVSCHLPTRALPPGPPPPPVAPVTPVTPPPKPAPPALSPCCPPLEQKNKDAGVGADFESRADAGVRAFLAWTSSGKPISTLCVMTPASDYAAHF
ncbi:hypothetical protein Anapl_01741 [Anas platyrhynchos]|uniref:Uncharacterized protein n=1 Tax=Anas platyrhynchos TaxID=8839 RepID=R0LMU0_ANAPL|nr:hypothetical protein Anapl_01741 [Anas platyrhynchos]